MAIFLVFYLTGNWCPSFCIDTICQQGRDRSYYSKCLVTF